MERWELLIIRPQLTGSCKERQESEWQSKEEWEEGSGEGKKEGKEKEEKEGRKRREESREEWRMLLKNAKEKFLMVFVCLPVP